MRINKIEIKNLSKKYKKTEALKNINITFYDNRIYGIIGPNGTGKTTLIKSLLSFLSSDGEINYYGISKSLEQAQISYVPELIDFYDYITGEDTRLLINEIQGNKNEMTSRRFEEISLILGYQDKYKLIRQHSKGNLRKLMICQSLSVEKEILIMDEPFDGLDPISIEKLKPLLLKYKAQNRFIVLSTHLYEIAKQVCDELIFLKNSSLLYQASKEEFGKIDLLTLYK